ncbi:hypothetical protein Q5P01_007557 [Channa striata]|uniref:PGC-1 and ERR-induced regulator in muscle protein 1 n=1 Tax=Channa striata TaxID=64152 RepID=A0AA88NCB1_CHASR|nr:hypothetical protein Q5P01_007557 [Channa striata]
MSDLDETESVLANRVQKVSLTTHLSDADHSLDGPPDCEGPPVEQFLSKHGVSGMENILSGSEEDLHLQSVNIFFERLKNLTEAERFAGPSKVKAGKNRGAVEEEQQCSDGKQASSSTSWPENTPKLNSRSARGETAVGKGLSRAVDTISNINTRKKPELVFNISPEHAGSNSVPKTNKSAYPETDLFIWEEACTEARANEVTQENQVRDSLVRVVCSKTKPRPDKATEVETGAHDLSRSQLTPEMLTSVKWKEDEKPNVPHSDPTSMNKTQSQESSPSASIKRKRRKKRRLSAEPAETGHGGRTQDSEDEQYTWRGEAGLCSSKDVDLLHSPNRNLQFPEAYEYFFPSSSSDDSSAESDEEDNCIKVVTRFSRKPSASKMSVDVYENFFTDSDLKQNFFWKETFSFRNIKFTGSTHPISNPLCLVPVGQSDRSLRRTVCPNNALGNQDFVFPDPLLCHLEDRISRQLAQQPFRYEDLQTALSNPRLDASLLPLRQSDMCLVCIAFASWVLKTTNPQVGDAWKAVLLANVSALSAIRYLRNVKMNK